MSVKPDPAPAPRMSRTIRIVLILSLTLNLLVLGFFVGAWISHGRDDWRDAGRSDVGMGPFFAALTTEDRRALFASLREQAGPLRANRDELRAQFDALLSALRADPFDIDAVKSAVVAQQERLSERFDIGKQLLFQRIEAMSPAERQAFADRLQEAIRRGPGFRHDRKRHGDGPPEPDND